MVENTKLKKIEIRKLLNDFFQDVDFENRIDANLANRIVDVHLPKFVPHLISSDEIKREAEYRTTYAPILEKSAVHRFIEDLDDRTIYDKEELLGIWAESYLTQQSLDKGDI